jgi:hypothetical protein
MLDPEDFFPPDMLADLPPAQQALIHRIGKEPWDAAVTRPVRAPGAARRSLRSRYPSLDCGAAGARSAPAGRGELSVAASPFRAGETEVGEARAALPRRDIVADGCRVARRLPNPKIPLLHR